MEFLTSLTTEAISKLGALVVDSTVKQFKYMIHHDKIIDNLKEEHKKLKAMKIALQSKVDADRRNELEIALDVQDWLRKVEDIDNELERFYENEANKNKKRFGGQCPDLAFNYSLGKRATKKAQDIAILKEEENKIKLISYPKPQPSLGSFLPEDIKAFGSRKAIVKEIMEKLKDERLKRVSICGMGGVGKTTLAKEVIKIVETSKLFDEVAMAAVSQNPNYENIQIQIADMLGLELKMKSMEGKAIQLHQRVTGDKRVLIVLDDVWDMLDFQSIGLPSLEQQKGCKILFTSRRVEVCEQMGSKENFIIPVLSEDEAWDLFQEMAGDVVVKPDIHHIAIQVAKECGGLPLALVIVAKALGSKEKYEWYNALDQLRDSPSSSFSDMQKLVYSRIEYSVNFLGCSEQKYCLLLCGLFPEDFDIPIESILRHGMGLGMFKGHGALWKARNLVHTLIGHLKRCFLLLDSDKPGCMKMHDVVRDVVISIASREHGLMVQYDAELMSLKEEKVDRIKAVSLILDETRGLKNGLEYPALQLLQVRSKITVPNPWPKHFFRGMSKLKILAMENLCIPTLPSLFQASANLHTLQVEHCDVGDISVIGKELVKLEVLSFAHSNIKELPTEIGQLDCLRLLDLTGCDDLYFISANVFKRLSRLEELYFGVRNFPWMHNKHALMELQSLSNHLKVIEIQVRKVEVLPQYLTFKNLEKFWVYVTPFSIFERRGYLELNILQFTTTNCKSIKDSLMIQELIKKCELLILDRVRGLKNVVYELDDMELPFPYLKDLRIDLCPDLQYLVDGIGPYNPFPQIQSLSLQSLHNLREICNVSDHHNNELMIKFLNLVNLKLMYLPSLTGFSKANDLNEPTKPIDHEPGSSNTTQSTDFTESEEDQLPPRSHPESSGHKILPITNKLFSTKWMQQFPKLETIFLFGCESLEMIFDLQGYSQLNGHSVATLFPQLKEIEISYLFNLRHIWGSAPNYVRGFQNLRSLTISGCHSLKYAFTPAIVRAIVKLETLVVEYCELMENLVVDSRDEELGDYKEKGKTKIVFDRLDTLALNGLPKIESICPKSYELELPSIREFKIEYCPKLNTSSLLTQALAKHDNPTITSGLSTFEEKHSRAANWHFGCTPFCSKLIRQGNTNKKSSKTALLPHDQVHSNSKRKIKLEMGHMPNLENLYVSNCELNDELFLQEGDHMRIRHCPIIDVYLFPKLTSLTVRDCNKNKVLLFLSSLTSLECLEELEVCDCENIEEIISQEEIEANSNKITFPSLQHLKLQQLCNLKAFCQGSSILDFPLLREVEIIDCPDMEVFSRGSSDTPKLEDFNMIGPHGSNYIHKGDMNTNIQGFKAFGTLHELEMLRWSILYNEGIFRYFISEMSIKNFHKLLMFVPFNEIRMLHHVRKLNIEECDSLVEVFESGGGMVAMKGYATTHYDIETMNLEKLPKLRHIWGPNILRLVSFNKLTSITIDRCESLKSVLSHSMARSLVQLQNLHVTKCEMMEEIITVEDENMVDGGNKVKTFFPKLEELYLIDLPKLECVCSRDYGYDIPLCDKEEEDKEIHNKQQIHISLPQLQRLKLLGVPSLKCFCPGAYDYDPMLSSSCVEDYTHSATFPNGNVIVSTPKLHEVYSSTGRMRTMGDVNLTIHYFQNSKKYKVELQKLETFRCIDQHQYHHLLGYITRETHLVLENCDKLLNCVPSNMMHLLQHVELLQVYDCGCLEEIYESNDSEGTELCWLQLYSLQKLKYIWRNHGPTLAFQNLEYLTISLCHDLRFVFPDVSLARSLPQLGTIKVRECNKMEEIIQKNDNNSIPKGAKVIFPSLSNIMLEKLPMLNCFCPSSFHFELPECWSIVIEECPKMETFCYGTLYTRGGCSISIEGRRLDRGEELNEVIQEIQRSQALLV